MEAVTIVVERIMDFGVTVGIVGIDTASNRRVVVHVDYRPLHAIATQWKAAGLIEPVVFDAPLTLNLHMVPMTEGEPPLAA